MTLLACCAGWRRWTGARRAGRHRHPICSLQHVATPLQASLHASARQGGTACALPVRCLCHSGRQGHGGWPAKECSALEQAGGMVQGRPPDHLPAMHLLPETWAGQCHVSSSGKPRSPVQASCWILHGCLELDSFVAWLFRCTVWSRRR